jgi:polyisoprenoid-binding protein YceI
LLAVASIPDEEENSMTQTQTETAVPTGTWTVDPVHSTVEFSVKHNVVATFRGRFEDVDGTIDESGVHGSARVESIAIDEPNLKGHLLSPDFFDAERFPELAFRSEAIHADGKTVEVNGDLTIKGVTKPVVLQGILTGPITDGYGGERVGLELETTVDRTAFGLNWNAPLPGGDFMLGNDVTIRGAFELTKAEA